MMKERERENGDKRAMEAKITALDDQLRETKTQLAVLQSQASSRACVACAPSD